MRKRVLARIFKVRIHWRKHINKLVSVALLRVSASVITRFRKRYHEIPQALSHDSASGNMRFLTETYRKVVRFRRIRSHGNMNKRHVSATGNTC